MPTYSARCSKCGKEQDYIAKIADRDKTPKCCKKPMERFITPTMVTAMGISDAFSFKSPIDGKQKYGRSEFMKILKENKILPSSDLAGEAEHRMKDIQAKDKAERVETIKKVLTKGG